jgi:homocysteine S-methyltransferase
MQDRIGEMHARGRELLERLRGEVLVGDGAMGTMLYGRGVPLGTCYDKLNLTDKEMVKSIHRQYVVAGADLIETNTFGANPFWLRRFGLDERAREINLAGARLAREVAGDRVFVAGSVGPLGLKTGDEIPADAADGYRTQALALAEGGADAIMLETFLDLEELSLAIRAVKAAVPELPVIASMAMFEKGRTARGVSIESALARADELHVDVFGTNCGKGPRQLIDAVERLVAAGPVRESTLLAAFPNAGYPEVVNGRYMYVTTPEYMAESARRLAAAGCALIGGCCGTTPSDTAAMKIALRARKRTPVLAARERLAKEAAAHAAEAAAKAGAGAASVPAEAKEPRAPAARRAALAGDILSAVPPGEHEWLARARRRAVAARREGEGAGTGTGTGTGTDRGTDRGTDTGHEPAEGAKGGGGAGGSEGEGAPAPPILVELDAPKDLDVEKGIRGARSLLKAGVDALTVGDNPLAIMRMSNLAFGYLLQRETGRHVIAHLSCRDRNLIGTQSELMGMAALGIHAVLGITGDPASIGNQPGASSVYDVNSFGLVELMARLNRGENAVGEPLAGRASFTIGVALNPNGRRIDDQLRRLQRKADLGAHFAQTQPCFDVARIREMYRRAAPVGVPIFLGILPLTSHRAAEFIHNEVPGIEVPERVRERLRGLEKEAAREEGQRIAREIIAETIDIAHGYYVIPPFNIAKNALELVAFIRERAGARAAAARA